MDKIVVNAMGEPCPIPVVKATAALRERKNKEALEIHVDNEIAVQNLTRLAGSRGLQLQREQPEEGHFVLTLSGEGTAPKEEPPVLCAPPAAGNTVVAIGSAVMGSGNDELGKLLMKGFLYALSQQEQLPKTILFYNGGAHIPIQDSVSVEDLKAMEAQGVEILTCGTCLDFYGLKDQLAVGGVTNMYSIVEILSRASHIIKP